MFSKSCILFRMKGVVIRSMPNSQYAIAIAKFTNFNIKISRSEVM